MLVVTTITKSCDYFIIQETASRSGFPSLLKHPSLHRGVFTVAIETLTGAEIEEEIGLEEEGDTMVEIVAGIDLIGHGGLKETACTIARID